MTKMINKFRLILNSISHKLYKQHRKYIFDIYSNYKQILDIRSKYDGNDILRETKLFLHRLSIEERMNDLNYYCEYDNDNQIINDAPFFSNIDDIRVVPILRGFAPKKKEKDLIKFIESIESEVQLEKIENLITLN